MKKKFLTTTLLLTTSVLLVACTDKTSEEKKDEMINDTSKKIEVLTKSQLVQADKQQADREVLIDNISNSILSVNTQFLSLEKLEEIKDVPIINSKFDKELQIIYIDNEIEKLNNLTANYLTVKELELVNHILKIKELEKDMYMILYDSWDNSKKKYNFNDKDKVNYEMYRKEILTFLVENEEEIINLTYMLIHPEIDEKDIKEHLDYQKFIYGLDKNNEIIFEETINGKISNIIYHLLTIEDDDIVKQKAIKEDIETIKSLQKEQKENPLYTKNKYIQNYIDYLLSINTDDLNKYLNENDYTNIYKEIQKAYKNMYYDYNEDDSFLYLNVIEFYKGTLKIEDEKLEEKVNDIIDENKTKEIIEMDNTVNEISTTETNETNSN